MSMSRIAAAAIVALGMSCSLFGHAGAETLKIGVIGPLTGAGAPWGTAMTQAAKILAAQYNADGGLDVGGKKYPIEVIAYDDQYRPPEAVSAYNRLVNQDGVKYIALVSGASTLAVRDRMEEDHIVGLSSGYAATAIDAHTKYNFRLWGIPADFFPPLYAWLRDNLKERRIVILNPNDEAARAMGEMGAKLAKADGFDVLLNDVYERSTKDFLPLITKVMALKPEIIDLGGSAPATAALLIRQAREQGYKGRFFVPVAAVREVVATAGKEAAEGAIMVLFVDPASQGYQRIAAEYTKAVGQAPNDNFAPYYDGINVMLHAIQKMGQINDTSKFEAGFAAALPMASVQGDMMTLGGKALYGVDHQINIVRYIAVVKNGEAAIVGKVQ
jgi:branched-chain amino acid transport system substrate-binding protein